MADRLTIACVKIANAEYNCDASSLEKCAENLVTLYSWLETIDFNHGKLIDNLPKFEAMNALRKTFNQPLKVTEKSMKEIVDFLVMVFPEVDKKTIKGICRSI